ncbi:hypothetical protein Tco_0999287, partial [Tanacetum coccineum]
IESSDSELEALKFSYCCFSRAFCVFFVASLLLHSLQIFSSAVEGTVIFNAVDGPVSDVVTGIDQSISKHRL